MIERDACAVDLAADAREEGIEQMAKFEVTHGGDVLTPGTGTYEASSYVRAAEKAHEQLLRSVFGKQASADDKAQAIDAQDWCVRCVDGGAAVSTRLLVTTRLNGDQPKAAHYTAV